MEGMVKESYYNSHEKKKLLKTCYMIFFNKYKKTNNDRKFLKYLKGIANYDDYKKDQLVSIYKDILKCEKDEYIKNIFEKYTEIMPQPPDFGDFIYTFTKKCAREVFYDLHLIKEHKNKVYKHMYNNLVDTIIKYASVYISDIADVYTNKKIIDDIIIPEDLYKKKSPHGDIKPNPIHLNTGINYTYLNKDDYMIKEYNNIKNDTKESISDVKYIKFNKRNV